LFYGTVTTEGVKLDQERAYQQFAKRKFLGKLIEVTIRAKRSKRSLDQNAYWHGVVVPMIADETGYDRHEHDQVHYALVSLCFGTHEDRLSHLQVPNARSSQLTTKQFTELIEWAVRWAAVTLGVVIPLPNEVPY
jgi:hypothetical protein